MGCGSRNIQARSRKSGPGFGKTLLLVVLLWVGTAVVLGIALPIIEPNPGGTYGPEFGVTVVTFQFYLAYGLIGTIAGLIMLIKWKPMGAGLLAGTAVGLILGFLTCNVIVGAMA